MLDNIRAHSIMVARVAEVLYNSLAMAKTSLPSKEEVVIGALMHDIAKTPCIGTQESHAVVGRDICISLGYPELGEIVAEHVLLKKFSEEHYKQGIFGAKELVFYSDKLVKHDQVTTLKIRQEYIIARYGNGQRHREQRIYANFATAFTLERYLFSFLPFAPEELGSRIDTSSENFVLSG